MAMKRWAKESQDFLDQLGGPKVNPLVDKSEVVPEKKAGKASREDVELRERLHDRQVARRGRPSLDDDRERSGKLKNYSFKITEERLSQLKRISLVETKMMQEILAEAVDEYIERHRDSLK